MRFPAWRAICSRTDTLGPPWSSSKNPTSGEALAGSQKEILGISTRLFHDRRIVAVFDFRFLKCKFYSNLRCVSSLMSENHVLPQNTPRALRKALYSLSVLRMWSRNHVCRKTNREDGMSGLPAMFGRWKLESFWANIWCS